MSDIDFNHEDYLRNPQETLFELVQKGPVLPVKLAKIGHACLISGSDALIDFLKSPHRFTTNAAEVGKTPIFDKAGIIPDTTPSSSSLFLKENSSHRQERQNLDLAFRKSGIKSLRPNIATLADALLENSSPLKGCPNTQRDIVSQFSRPLAALVMMELMGISKNKAPDILNWMTQISFPEGALGGMNRKSAAKKLLQYLETFFSDESALPNGSLGWHLLENSEANTHVATAQLAYFLLLAGHSPTSNLISLGCLTLLEHPQQLSLLKEDWTRSSSAVEEILRYASPAQTTSARYAKDNFEFHGHQFKRGDIALGFLAASNMDPTTNIDPLDFNITRNPIRQISFGAGAHFCGGAQLAHIITEIALQRLFSKWSDMQIPALQTSKHITWSPRFGVRNLTRFMIETHNSSSRF